jgi:hypothetical protein
MKRKIEFVLKSVIDASLKIPKITPPIRNNQEYILRVSTKDGNVTYEGCLKNYMLN